MSKSKKSTIEFLGVWKSFQNPNFNYGELAVIKSFKPLEFEGIKMLAGLNSFVLTPKQWIDATNAIGLVSKQERCI
jgi:hypothetical protein